MKTYSCPNCLERYYRVDEKLIGSELKEYHNYWNRYYGMWAYWCMAEQGYLCKINNICCGLELP